MGRTFDAPLVITKPMDFAVGQDLFASRMQRLIRNANWCHAYGHAQNLVPQGFGADVLSKVAVIGGTPECVWRFPELGAAWTTVRCHVWAEFAGAAGNGEVTFSTGAGSVTLNILPGGADWYSGNCSISPASGFEEIEMYVGGDATDETIVHEVEIEYVPLTTPIASGVSSGITPLDDDETDADSCGSSDLIQFARSNFSTLLDRERVYYNLSGIAGIVADLDEGHHHRVWVPVHFGTREIEGYTLNVHIRATPDVADPRYIHIHHGGKGDTIGRRGAEGIDMTTVEIPADAAGVPKWYVSGTDFEHIRLDESAIIQATPYPMAQIAIWPGNRDWAGVGGFTDRDVQNGGRISPAIHTISVWGR